MALKLPDSAVPMGDFPVAKAVDIDFDDGENLQEKLDNGKLGGEGNTTDEVLKKTDITKTIDGSSTDTQIPSAKTINDKFEEANVYKGKYEGDLNDIPFIKSGVVYKYDIRSGDCTNTPVDIHGILHSTYFDSVDYCLQEFHSLQTNIASIYRRYKGAGVWSAWKELATMDKVDEELDKKIERDNVAKIIEGKEIDQTVMDEYGTEILKYPLGIWRISSDSIANKFSDLPVKTCGRIEITSINSDTNRNPWDNSYGYRVCNFETCDWMNYSRKLISGSTPGVNHDTGWQEIATMDKVEGVYAKTSDIKRVYNSIEELNTAKGLSISFTNGEDNTMKIVDALSPIETFADYFSNGINNNRFGIDTNTYGTDIVLLTITKFNDNTTMIRAFMINGKLLVRRHINGVLGDWQYDKTDLSEVNTKLTQLENTINEVGGGGIYQSGEIEVGTWTGGQKLYRYTISDSTERTFSSGTMMLDFFTLSRNEHVVVKLDGTFRMCAASDDSGAHTVYALPYVDLETNRQVHLVYTTQDRVRLSGKNLKDYKILGYDVSIYYYKK